MCNKAAFAKLRDQSAENSRQIAALQQTDAVQSEQIKTLFHTAEKQGAQQDKMTSRLVWAAVVALFLALFAVIYGALGPHGFNAVTKAVPAVAGSGE